MNPSKFFFWNWNKFLSFLPQKKVSFLSGSPTTGQASQKNLIFILTILVLCILYLNFLIKAISFWWPSFGMMSTRLAGGRCWWRRWRRWPSSWRRPPEQSRPQLRGEPLQSRLAKKTFTLALLLACWTAHNVVQSSLVMWMMILHYVRHPKFH